MKKRILSVLLVLVLVVGILPIGVSAEETQGEYISVDYYYNGPGLKTNLTVVVKNTVGDTLDTIEPFEAYRSGSTMTISLNPSYHGIYELDRISIDNGDVYNWSGSFNDSYKSTFTWSSDNDSATLTITLKEAEHTLELKKGSLNIGRIAYKEGLQRTNVNVFLNYEPFVSFEDVRIANTLNNFILTLDDGYYYGVAANNMDYSSEISGQTITYTMGNGSNIYNKLTFGVPSTSVSYQNKLNTINLYMFTYQDGFNVDFTRMVNGGALNLDDACKTFDVKFTYGKTNYAFTYDKWDQTHTLFMPHDTLIYVNPNIKPNYHFDTWKTNDALGDHANSIYTILEDGTLHEEVSGPTIEGVYAYSQNMAFKYSSGYTRAEIILRMVDGNTSPYTITYHSNNGQNQTETEHFYTGAYIDGNSFEYAGHTFVNWNTQEDGNGQSYEEHAFYDTKSDLNLYAQWKNDAQSEKTYTLTYNANGGSGEPDPVQVAENTTYPLSTQGPTTPPTHTTTLLFEGWTLDDTKLGILTKDAAEDDIPQISNTIYMDQPYTVYAVWAEDSNNNGKPDYKETPITVMFNADPGTAEGTTKYILQPFSTTVGQAPAVTAPEGQKFAQWQQRDGTHTLADQAHFTYDSIFAMTGGTASTVIFDAQYDNLPPAITDPTDDELADLFKDKISVACVNDQVSHSAKHYGYEANGFSIGAVTEVHGVYTVKATTNASYYLSKYNTDTVTKHALASYQTKTVTVELVWNGSKWTLNDAVTIKVICETPVSPAVPEKPSYSDIASLFRSSIQVDCVSKSYHKTGVYGLLTDGYTVSAPVKGSDGKYTCTVTLLANVYLAKYNDSFGYAKHSLASYQGNESVTLKWNEAEEEWNTVYGQLPVTIDVVCKNYIPVLPSLPDVPDDTTPNWLNLDDHDAYIQGYPDGRVKPENNITRAEVATIFYRLLTDDAREYFWSNDSGFSDVKPGDWYNTAVSTMVNAGVITGYNDGTFRPNDPITRAEFATIAARFLSDPYSLQDQFYDTEGHWAEVYINRAAEVGWINGYNDGSFRPNKAITRAEAVTLVNNVLGREPHADYMLDDMITWPDNPKSAWYYEDIQEATNSHDYRWSSGKRYEIWTSLN